MLLYIIITLNVYGILGLYYSFFKEYKLFTYMCPQRSTETSHAQ